MRPLSRPSSTRSALLPRIILLMAVHLAGAGLSPAESAPANDPPPEKTFPLSQEEQIARAGEKLARIFAGIAESVQAQEIIVKRRRARMLQLIDEHTIIDPHAFPQVRDHGWSIGDVSLPRDGTKLRKLRFMAATMSGIERALSRCPRGQLCQAICALGLDATVAALSSRPELAMKRLDQMTDSGLGANHPGRMAPAATIRQMESVLDVAAKKYGEWAVSEMSCLRTLLAKAEKDEADGGTAEISPEVMEQYTEQRTQWEIASTLLEKCKASALDLTNLALDSYERDLELITEDALRSGTRPAGGDGAAPGLPSAKE